MNLHHDYTTGHPAEDCADCEALTDGRLRVNGKHGGSRLVPVCRACRRNYPGPIAEPAVKVARNLTSQRTHAIRLALADAAPLTMLNVGYAGVPYGRSALCGVALDGAAIMRTPGTTDYADAETADRALLNCPTCRYAVKQDAK